MAHPKSNNSDGDFSAVIDRLSLMSGDADKDKEISHINNLYEKFSHSCETNFCEEIDWTPSDSMDNTMDWSPEEEDNSMDWTPSDNDTMVHSPEENYTMDWTPEEGMKDSKKDSMDWNPVIDDGRDPQKVHHATLHDKAVDRSNNESGAEGSTYCFGYRFGRPNLNWNIYI